MQNRTNALIATILRRAILDCIAGSGGELDYGSEPDKIFTSAAAQAVKEEIVRAGRKLWERQYVDGNGGNLSVRVSDDYVLCTPTLCGKGDMTPADISLVDLHNRKICGERVPTSEILLHLEIYKTVPSARAVVHCHPPYATAYAVAGIAPRGNLIPEQEVFVGPVALAPYDTPGTMGFARTIIPFVKEHNTVLLTNHGIVCWADTIEHAEWYAEVVENYCKIVTIASGLGSPIREIPASKIPGLLSMKKRLGLPDPRLTPLNDGAQEMQRPLERNGRKTQPTKTHDAAAPTSEEIDALVLRLTPQVEAFLEHGSSPDGNARKGRPASSKQNAQQRVKQST
jgi:L-fuculose-phosphate aldolase